jgi:hypothetical protein
MPLLAGDGLNLFFDVDVDNHMFGRGKRARGPTFRVGTYIASGTWDIVLDFAGSSRTDENRIAVLVVAGVCCEHAGGGIGGRAGRDQLIQFGDIDRRMAGAGREDGNWVDSAGDGNRIASRVEVITSEDVVGGESGSRPEQSNGQEKSLHVASGRRSKRRRICLYRLPCL